MRNGSRACPAFQRAVALFSKRWTGLIVHALLDGPCRFGTLSLAVEGLSDRMLSERLKELEAEASSPGASAPVHPSRLSTP